MRRLVIVLVLASLVAVPPAHAATPPPTYSDNVAVGGLNAPTAIAFMRGG